MLLLLLLLLLLCDPTSSYWASQLRRCVVVDVTREDLWPILPCRRASVICDGPLAAGGLGIMSIDVVPPGCTDQKSLDGLLLFGKAKAHKHSRCAPWPQAPAHLSRRPRAHRTGTAVSVPSAASRCLAFSVPVQRDGIAAGLWAGYGLSAACWILESLSSADGLPSYQISGHCCHHLTCACAATTNADIYFCKPK